MTRIAIIITDNAAKQSREVTMDWPTFCKGVAVGSSPECAVHLDDSTLHPVHARIERASNHNLLYLFPDGGSLPLQPLPRPVSHYDARVDSAPFQIGRFTLRVREIGD